MLNKITSTKFSKNISIDQNKHENKNPNSQKNLINLDGKIAMKIMKSTQEKTEITLTKKTGQFLKEHTLLPSESSIDTRITLKTCAKCKKEFTYPIQYFQHCIHKSNETHFRCCDNINLDTEKMNKIELKTYNKYLRTQYATVLIDIQNYWKHQFNSCNRTEKFKQMLRSKKIGQKELEIPIRRRAEGIQTSTTEYQW